MCCIECCDEAKDGVTQGSVLVVVVVVGYFLVGFSFLSDIQQQNTARRKSTCGIVLLLAFAIANFAYV
jgi:hypothetical protein